MRNLNGVKFIYQDKKLTFKIERYAFSNNALAITLTTDDQESPLNAQLTINIPYVSLQKDEILVKTWSENKDISDFLRNSEFFKDTGARVLQDKWKAEIWKMKCGLHKCALDKCRIFRNLLPIIGIPSERE